MKSSLHQELEERFRDEKVSYILITCEQGFDGSLAVEMSYNGADSALASYLLSDAQDHLTHEND